MYSMHGMAWSLVSSPVVDLHALYGHVQSLIWIPLTHTVLLVDRGKIFDPKDKNMIFQNMTSKITSLRYILPNVLISFSWFSVVRKDIIFKENSFFIHSEYWASVSTHFANLSDKFWIPLQKNCSSFAANHLLSHFPTSSESLKCCSASACPIDSKRWYSDDARSGSMAGAKDVPSKWFYGVWDRALSCNKITLPCLLAHSGHFSINVWFKLMICWW